VLFDQADGVTGVTLSEEMIIRSASKADTRRGQHESLEEYLKRLTHLSLNEKNIGRAVQVGRTTAVTMTAAGSWGAWYQRFNAKI